MQDRLIIIVIISVPLLLLSLRLAGHAFGKPRAQRMAMLLIWLVVAAPVCGLFGWLLTEQPLWLILGLPSAVVVLVGWAYSRFGEARDQAKLGASVLIRFVEVLIDPQTRRSTKIGLVLVGLEVIAVIPIIAAVYILFEDVGEYAAIVAAAACVWLMAIQIRALRRSSGTNGTN